MFVLFKWFLLRSCQGDVTRCDDDDDLTPGVAISRAQIAPVCHCEQLLINGFVLEGNFIKWRTTSQAGSEFDARHEHLRKQPKGRIVWIWALLGVTTVITALRDTSTCCRTKFANPAKRSIGCQTVAALWKAHNSACYSDRLSAINTISWRHSTKGLIFPFHTSTNLNACRRWDRDPFDKKVAQSFSLQLRESSFQWFLMPHTAWLK